MEQQPVNYQAELDKLPPEERDAYTARWQEHLSGLPKGAYVGQLTKLTQQFGPEFASSLVQPSLTVPEQEVPAVGQYPIEEFRAEQEVPWYAKPAQWAMEQPALRPAIETWEKYRKGWLTPAAMTLAQTYSPELLKLVEHCTEREIVSYIRAVDFLNLSQAVHTWSIYLAWRLCTARASKIKLIKPLLPFHLWDYVDLQTGAYRDHQYILHMSSLHSRKK